MVQQLADATERSERRSTHQEPHSNQPKFGSDDAFYREICRRVDGYFQQTGKPRRDCPRMYVKTAIVLTWFTSSYVLLVFAASTWWAAVPLGISLCYRWPQSDSIFSTTVPMALYSNMPLG